MLFVGPKIMKRELCQAHVVVTNSRCSKPAVRGTRYCWWHQSKGLFVFTLVAGAFLSLVVSETWRLIVPSPEQKEVNALRHDYAASLTAPAFRLFLNGREVFERSVVAIPITNSSPSLEFTVLNSGNLMAENLKISIKLPQDIPAFHATGFWQEQKASFVSGGKVELLKDKSFILEAQGTFAPGDTFGCSPLVIDHPLASPPESFPLHVRIAAMKAEPQYFPLSVLLLPGLREVFVNRAETKDVLPSTARYWR